jgi:MarR family transcriptional regulator, organic hydroperoxide resistance regulator
MQTTTVNQLPSKQWDAILAPNNLGYRIKLFSQMLSRKFQEQLEPFGLTPCHWIVLCCLWEEDGLPTSIVGERVQQVGGTLTGVLDRMEAKGLVYRHRDDRDRRIWRIWLTPAGLELEAHLPSIAQTVTEQALLGMNSQQRQQLSQLIDRAIANLT